jgi:glucose-1-phosphate cytidylyltransferase
MKVMILAGGLGTRISEYTDVIPKPMVPIGGNPIIWHIMNYYSQFGHNDFYVALGYKASVIKDYFLKYKELNSNFSVNLKSGKVLSLNPAPVDWNVTLVDTGQETMTGGRMKRLKDYVGNETFMLTYGDGVSDVDIGDLLKFHKSHGKMVTVTAVRPQARFGELNINGDNSVASFQEKPQIHEGWVNGGFFVIEPEFFDFIEGDETFLEREPLEKVSSIGQLFAYKHHGFWQCMDTKRDHEYLEGRYEQYKSKWLMSENK